MICIKMFGKYRLDHLAVVIAYNAVTIICIHVAAGIYSECVDKDSQNIITPIDTDTADIAITCTGSVLISSVVYTIYIVLRSNTYTSLDDILTDALLTLIHVPLMLYLILSENIRRCSGIDKYHMYALMLIYAPVFCPFASAALIFMTKFVIYVGMRVSCSCKYRDDETRPLLSGSRTNNQLNNPTSDASKCIN